MARPVDIVYLQMVLSSMVSVVEPLLLETSDKLTSVECELLLLTLRRFDESVAPTLTPSSDEMSLFLHAVKSQRRIAAGGNSLAAAAITQVRPWLHVK